MSDSIQRGLADSAAGRVTDGGDFTQYAETAQWSQPASEQIITMPGLAILATLNADGTVTVDIDANQGTVQRVTLNDKEVL